MMMTLSHQSLLFGSISGDSDVRTLHDKLLDLGQRASASIAPVSYKAFQGYQLRGAFMVG